MGHYTCEYGVVHKTCRCPTPHTIKCDKVDEHRPEGTGAWVTEAKPHKCDKPFYLSEVPAILNVTYGDTWECFICETVWKVIGFDSGMQWDPYPTVIKWERVEP